MLPDPLHTPLDGAQTVAFVEDQVTNTVIPTGIVVGFAEMVTVGVVDGAGVVTGVVTVVVVIGTAGAVVVAVLMIGVFSVGGATVVAGVLLRAELTLERVAWSTPNDSKTDIMEPI